MFNWLMSSPALVLFKICTLLYLTFLAFVFVSWYFKKRWYLTLWKNNHDIIFFVLLNGIGFTFGWFLEILRPISRTPDTIVSPVCYFPVLAVALLCIGCKYVIKARDNIRGDY